MNDLSSETIQFIISRVMDNANDAIAEAKENPSDVFFAGKLLAYYEVLDTIKNELIVREQDLAKFGLDVDLEGMLH